MKEEFRQTGIDAVEVPWGTHLCHFYETKADLLDTLVPYLKAGLDNHEFCMWMVPDTLTHAEAVQALAEVLPDITERLVAGDIEIISHRDWYLRSDRFSLRSVVEGWKTRLEAALAKGYSGIRVTGDTSWVKDQGREDLAKYERAIDEMIGDLRMTALCTYPLNTSGANQVLDVICTHQVALAKRNGKLAVIETSENKKAKAEIERLNVELESRVLMRTKELARANEELKKEIIERKRVEKELRESEAQLTEAQHLSQIGSWEWDLLNDTLKWSDELYRIFGMNRGDSVAHLERYYGDDPPRRPARSKHPDRKGGAGKGIVHLRASPHLAGRNDQDTAVTRRGCGRSGW